MYQRRVSCAAGSAVLRLSDSRVAHQIRIREAALRTANVTIQPVIPARV